MKALEIIALAALASAAPLAMPPAPPIAPATMDNGMPPKRFHGNSSAVIIFTDRAGIDELCDTADPGFQIVACKRTFENGVPLVVVPNPCPIGNVELYAKIMCHEMAHVNGWSREHEE